MYNSALIFLGLLGIASAANSTTSLWLLGFYFDEQTVLGSVIASDATATTYSIACGDSTDDCGLPTPLIYTQGPSTLHYSYVEAQATGVTETVELGCVVTSSASGICSATVQADTVSSTTTSAFTGLNVVGIAVTITAGASPASTASTTIDSSKSTLTSASTPSSSGSAIGGSTGSSAGSSTATSASVSKNGGMPMITQAPWALGAMAAGMALAAV